MEVRVDLKKGQREKVRGQQLKKVECETLVLKAGSGAR
jgi:hypothetical protein